MSSLPMNAPQRAWNSSGLLRSKRTDDPDIIWNDQRARPWPDELKIIREHAVALGAHCALVNLCRDDPLFLDVEYRCRNRGERPFEKIRRTFPIRAAEHAERDPGEEIAERIRREEAEQ